jgi:hypothetical protein
MFSKNLGISLYLCAWSMAFASIYFWSLGAPIGDFYHMDGVSVLVVIGFAVFVTALVLFDHSFDVVGNRAYAEYCGYAKSRGFQPMGLESFEALHRAGFDPVTKLWS